MRLRFNHSPHAWWRRWRPLTAAVVALGLGAMATGCSDDGPAASDEAQTVKLKINVAAVEPAGGQRSRAEFETTGYVNEMMRTLRIIIVHTDPTDQARSRKVVEFNQFWDLAGEANADDKTEIAASASKEINVYAGGKGDTGDQKEIYVIANEKARYSGYTHSAGTQVDDEASDMVLAGIDLSNETYGSGAVLDDDAIKALETLTFTYDPTRDIKGLVPMAEHHKVYVQRPEIDAQGNKIDREQAVSIFLTRTLVKVTVNVVNASSAPLELTGYRLTNMARTGYLFPCNTVYSPAKAGCQQEDPLKAREITSFAIPAQQLYTFERTFTMLPAGTTGTESDNVYALETIASGESVTLPSVYLPESQADNLGIDISLFGEFRETPQVLDQLSGKLPRNTHLIIDVKINENMGMTIRSVVLPYIGVNLEPDFGI